MKRRVNKITSDLLLEVDYKTCGDILGNKVYMRLVKKRNRLREELYEINGIYKQMIDKI